MRLIVIHKLYLMIYNDISVMYTITIQYMY